MSSSGSDLVRPSRLGSLSLTDTSEATGLEGGLGGVTVHTPTEGWRAEWRPACPSPKIQEKIRELSLPHNLNQQKQTKRLIKDLSKVPVTLELSNNGGDVNIKCNPDFYKHVGKPALCQLSEGFTFRHPCSSFLLTDISLQRDQAGFEQAKVFKFSFTTRGVKSNVTIHLHNGTRNIQVQGTQGMPDCSTAAVWFIKNILDNHFTALADTKKIDLTEYRNCMLAFNGTDPSTAPARSKVRKGSSVGLPDCGVCGKRLRATGYRPCRSLTCERLFHGTCVKEHMCVSDNAQTSVSITLARKRSSADVSFLDSDDEADNPSHLALIPTHLPELSADSAAVSTTEAVVMTAATPASATTTVSVTATTTTENITTVTANNTALAVALAVAPQSSTSSTSNNSTLHSNPSFTFSSLPALSFSAPAFLPRQVGTRPKQAKPVAKKSRGVATTPEGVHLEYLNHEITVARTKITSLESGIKDRDDSIKILGDRIKAMEAPRFSHLRDQYLTPSPPGARSQTPTVTPPCQGTPTLQLLVTEVADLRVQIANLQDLIVSFVTDPQEPRSTTFSGSVTGAGPHTRPGASPTTKAVSGITSSHNTGTTRPSTVGGRTPSNAAPFIVNPSVPPPHQVQVGATARLPFAFASRSHLSSPPPAPLVQTPTTHLKPAMDSDRGQVQGNLGATRPLGSRSQVEASLLGPPPGHARPGAQPPSLLSIPPLFPSSPSPQTTNDFSGLQNSKARKKKPKAKGGRRLGGAAQESVQAQTFTSPPPPPYMSVPDTVRACWETQYLKAHVQPVVQMASPPQIQVSPPTQSTFVSPASYLNL